MFIRLLSGVLPVLMIISAFAQADGSDPFRGKYSGDNVEITLSGNGVQYTGMVVADGQSFPLSAQKVNESTISGMYIFQGKQYPFQAQIQGDTLTLHSGGEVYTLLRSESSKTVGSPLSPKQNVTISPNNQISNTETGDLAMGFKFKIPPGWIAQKNAVGYIMGSKTEKGFILLLMHQLNSLDELRSGAKEGIIDQNGTVLHLVGSIKTFGPQGVAGEFAGTVEYQPAKAYAISLMSPYGGGVTILSVVEKKSYTAEYARLTETVARSLQFFQPQAPPITEEWKQRLNGARLTYMWSYYSGGGGGSYVGGSQKTIIDLCEQGYFRYSDNNQMAVDGGSGGGYNASGYSGGSNKGQGTWQVIARGNQPILQLQFHDGKVYEYVLSLDGSKTYLDNKRFFRTYSDAPVEDHRPQCW